MMTITIVKVFKTNVRNIKQAKLILQKLQEQIPGSHVNFDLEDIDNILRIEGENICVAGTVLLLKNHGYNCEELL